MFVMTLPLIVLFLCALIDFGRVVFMQMAIDEAAQAACRRASEQISTGDGASSARAAAERSVSESFRLAGTGVSVQVQASVGTLERVGYSRQRYSAQEHGFAEVPSSVDSRKVEVAVKAQVACLTPLGSAAAGAAGGDDRICVESRAAGVAWVAERG